MGRWISLMSMLVACGPGALGGGSDPVCEDYLDCITAVTPEAAGAAVALYGDDSSCWASTDDGDRCKIACDESLSQLAEAFPGEATCTGPADVGQGSFAEVQTRWLVYVESDGESCGPPFQGMPMEAETSNTGGDDFELTITDPIGMPMYPFECASDGLDFTCDKLTLPGELKFKSAMGSANSALDAFSMTAVATVDGESCGTWSFDGEEY